MIRPAFEPQPLIWRNLSCDHRTFHYLGTLMELAKRDTQLKTSGSIIKLFPIGDTHLGAPTSDVNKIERVVQLVANDPDAYWVGMGDYADCIAPGDKRWRLRNIDWKTVRMDQRGQPDTSDLAEWMVEGVENVFRPILTPEKCLGLLEGNHERSLADQFFTDITRRLCKRYGVQFLGQTAVLRWLFHRSTPGGHTATYDIFAEHGATGGGTDGNATNNFITRMVNWDADIYLKGHVHKRDITRKTTFHWGSKEVIERDHILALTGCYLKGYELGGLTYSEQKGYPPNELGGTVIVIQPFKQKVDAMYIEAFEMLTEGAT